MFRAIAWLVVGLSLGGPRSFAQPSGVWLDVPLVRQEKNGCGAASLAMVMQYWQRHGELRHSHGSDPEQIQESLYSQKAHGIYASAMERFLRQHGFRTFAFAGRWIDLKEQLEKGRPLIVALQPARSELHYVVITGLDWRQDLVLKNDPAERKLLKQDRSTFEREWKDAGNWTLLAVPRQDGGESSP